ncbi:hypothetical protein D9758_017043 [Tetrapyrgos nigripes]|uniref:Uncharacterized protein n=1 Tax=Tetrapyrgos nigripes TaxID=182062 RepID=A0A8H5CK27_9AGAR|nr:hypothetical protein D9758_017043 [Tetrapyrgos nigripes]
MGRWLYGERVRSEWALEVVGLAFASTRTGQDGLGEWRRDEDGDGDGDAWWWSFGFTVNGEFVEGEERKQKTDVLSLVTFLSKISQRPSPPCPPASSSSSSNPNPAKTTRIKMPRTMSLCPPTTPPFASPNGQLHPCTPPTPTLPSSPSSHTPSFAPKAFLSEHGYPFPPTPALPTLRHRLWPSLLMPLKLILIAASTTWVRRSVDLDLVVGNLERRGGDEVTQKSHSSPPPPPHPHYPPRSPTLGPILPSTKLLHPGWSQLLPKYDQLSLIRDASAFSDSFVNAQSNLTLLNQVLCGDWKTCNLPGPSGQGGEGVQSDSLLTYALHILPSPLQHQHIVLRFLHRSGGFRRIRHIPLFVTSRRPIPQTLQSRAVERVREFCWGGWIPLPSPPPPHPTPFPVLKIPPQSPPTPT